MNNDHVFPDTYTVILRQESFFYNKNLALGKTRSLCLIKLGISTHRLGALGLRRASLQKLV
jgi:hypothetical protein